MCDRILVFSSQSRPGRERTAGPLPASAQPPGPGLPQAGRRHLRADDAPRAGAPQRRAAPPRPVSRCRCSMFSTNLMAGLIETLAAPPYNGRADLPALAGALQMEVDELLPIGETLQLLGIRRAGGGRHAAHRPAAGTSSRRTRTSRKRHLRRRAARPSAARRADPPGAGRALEPPRRPRCASATSWRTTCRPTTPTRRCGRPSPGAAIAELYSYDEEAEQFSLEEEE